MKKNPEISVLLPIFNGENTLKRCLLSLLSQSFSNFEIIAIDDGSTDHSLQILQSLQDSRIKCYAYKQNRGLARTLNEAMKHGKGQFYARMDQDDFSWKHRFEKQIHFLKKNPDVGVLGTGIRICSQLQKTRTRFYPRNHSQIRTTMIFGSPCAHPTLMFRREIYDQGLRYSSKYEFSEDWKFLFDCSKQWKINNIHEVLLNYHLSATGISRKNYQRAFSARKKVAEHLLEKIGFPKNKINYQTHLLVSNPQSYSSKKLRSISKHLLFLFQNANKQTYVPPKSFQCHILARFLRILRFAGLKKTLLIARKLIEINKNSS